MLITCILSIYVDILCYLALKIKPSPTCVVCALQTSLSNLICFHIWLISRSCDIFCTSMRLLCTHIQSNESSAKTLLVRHALLWPSVLIQVKMGWFDLETHKSRKTAGVNKVTILHHLFTSLMSVSPYFITRNSTFSLSKYWFFLIFVTGSTNYIIFYHVWSFLVQFLTREAYFSNLITSVYYANHVSISTPADDVIGVP